MNLRAVRFAMADALDAIDGLNVSPYAKAQPIPPGLQIIPPGVAYDFSMGLDEWAFIVQGFVALTDDTASQQLLDELCAPTGVKAILEADKSLGGAVNTLRVIDQSPGIMVERGGSGPMLLVEWRVQVFANGG